MSRGTNQKFKFTYLMQVMLEKTDDEHSLTLNQILEELEKYDVTAEYNEKADEAEKEGYPRFARTLRLIAEDYHNEGLANIEEAKNGNYFFKGE